jgi:hypothetical protein
MKKMVLDTSELKIKKNISIFSCLATDQTFVKISGLSAYFLKKALATLVRTKE